MLRTDLAAALDPVILARRAGLEADEWQASLLRSTAKEILLLCCRQSGKSTTVSFLAVYEALYRSPCLTLCLSPSQRQSTELFRKIQAALATLGVRPKEESTLRLELPNGSRIVALPGKDDATVRGYSGVTLLLIDEASRVSDALYQSVRPMLAVSGGRLIGLTTPWGKRGWFHGEWTEGGASFHRVKVTAAQCPRIDPAWLARERDLIPAFVYAQEYDCIFTDTEDTVFAYDLVRAAVTPQVTPLFAGA